MTFSKSGNRTCIICDQFNGKPYSFFYGNKRNNSYWIEYRMTNFICDQCLEKEAKHSLTIRFKFAIFSILLSLVIPLLFYLTLKEKFHDNIFYLGIVSLVLLALGFFLAKDFLSFIKSKKTYYEKTETGSRIALNNKRKRTGSYNLFLTPNEYREIKIIDENSIFGEYFDEYQLSKDDRRRLEERNFGYAWLRELKDMERCENAEEKDIYDVFIFTDPVKLVNSLPDTVIEGSHSWRFIRKDGDREHYSHLIRRTGKNSWKLFKFSESKLKNLELKAQLKAQLQDQIEESLRSLEESLRSLSVTPLEKIPKKISYEYEEQEGELFKLNELIDYLPKPFEILGENSSHVKIYHRSGGRETEYHIYRKSRKYYLVIAESKFTD